MSGFGKKNKENKCSSKKLQKLSERDLKAISINHHVKGNLKEAEKGYITFLKNGYLDADIISNYALICEERSENEKAIKLHHKCAKSFPNHIYSKINLSFLYYKLNNLTQAEKIIEEAWGKKESINQNSEATIIDSINQIIEDLDAGKIRVAEKINNEWVTHQYIKKAIMLSFRIHGMEALSGPYSSWYDKAHLLKGKTAGWNKEDFEKAGFRMVPNSPVRKGSYIAKNVVLMPCFINTGAYIDSGTMMDTFSRAGSCCQIGKNCHISAGSGVGGVLEPAQALPTIIEDNVFLGAMSEVVEGVIVGEGSVISMGMYIGQSTKIVDRKSGEITYGKIPAYSVIVPGSLPDKNNPSAPSLSCAVIIKKVDEKTRSKTSINDLLRD